MRIPVAPTFQSGPLLMEREKRSVVDGQTIEGPLDEIEVGGSIVVGVGMGRQLRALARQGPDRDLADDPASAAADRGAAGVDDDPPEPGAEVVRVAKLRQIAPGSKEDLLGRIARIGLVAENRQSCPEGGGKPAIDNGGERLAVPATGSFDQGRFAHPDRRCHHDAAHVPVSPSLCRVQRLTPHR
jgi:hypothetical protein